MHGGPPPSPNIPPPDSYLPPFGGLVVMVAFMAWGWGGGGAPPAAYNAIMQHSPAKPVLIFVSSRRQTRLTALDLISYLAADQREKMFVRMTEDNLLLVLDQVQDQHLRPGQSPPPPSSHPPDSISSGITRILPPPNFPPLVFYGHFCSVKCCFNTGSNLLLKQQLPIGRTRAAAPPRHTLTFGIGPGPPSRMTELLLITFFAK